MVVKFSSLLNFQPIHCHNISNERYFIGELKFMLPHSKILPVTSSKSAPNISNEWASMKVWFDEAR